MSFDVAVLGTGDVGKALAVGLSETGSSVVVGTRSPDREELVAWAAGARVELGTSADAADAAEVVVLATAWNGTEATLDGVRDAVAGKVLVDVTNPLQFTDRLELALGHTDSGGEQVQRWAPQAHVVKAFNTVGYEQFDRRALADAPATLFVASDHDDARQVAADFGERLGWAVHDCGELRAARHTEPLAMVWIEHTMRTGQRDHVFSLG